MKPINEITFEDIRQMERDGEFKNKVPYPTAIKNMGVTENDGYIFDENQTVAWNKEQIKEFNAKIKQKKLLYSLGKDKAMDFFCDCLITAIMNNTKLPEEKAQKIYGKAYQDGHSAGYYEVISCASELCDFVMSIL